MSWPVNRPGGAGTYDPRQFRQPPTQRQLERARVAREVLERRRPQRRRRRFSELGLRRASRRNR